MFYDPDLSYSSNRHLGLNDEESEVLRLRNMLRENILKVERENMEAIQKDLLNQKIEPNSKNVMNNAQEKVPKVSANKSSVSLKRRPISLDAKSPQTKKDFDVKSSNLPTSPGSLTKTSRCPFSNIHFLNHFQSSYFSSKPVCRIKSWNEMDHINHLDSSSTTIPKYVPVQSHLKEDYPKPVVHNKKRIYKNLTVQALPSITINGETNFKRNILMEELKKESHSTENCLKTTMLPSNQIRFKTKEIQDNIKDNIIYTKKGIQVKDQPTRTVYTQSSLDSKEELVSKEYVKELVKEVLEDFKLEWKLPGSAERESRIISCRNDCELDSFIGNTVPKISDESLHLRNITKYSTFTQTSIDTSNTRFDKSQMKDLMKEVIHEYQQINPVDVMPNRNVQYLIPKEMVCKGTQTAEPDCDVSHDKCVVSKAVQVSLLPENPNCDRDLNLADKHPDFNSIDKASEISKATLRKNIQSTVSDATLPSNPSPSNVFPSELCTRLECVINSIYERFCKDDPVPDVSKSNAPKPSITTTETSVQLDPIPTINKSICTDKVILVSSANQSDPILPPQSEKSLIHAFVQSDSIEAALQQQRDASTQYNQCPRVASKDVCLQTFEAFHSEGSANTSVSGTPVSDSMFLDDMLSDGEVFLPWNLRLLSYSDKSQLQSSSNIATEDSCSSDKEKDYSLSEGEIPPNYFQQMNAMLPPYDSGSDFPQATVHQSTSILCQMSPFQTNPSGPSSTHYNNCCQMPSLSLSEGEVRNTSTLSEGQILFHSSQLFPKQPFLPQTIESTALCGSKDSNLVYPSTSVKESHASHLISSQKLHSGSTLIEGEIEVHHIPGIANKPCGLFTLIEEK